MNRVNILLVDDDYVLAKGAAKLIQRLGGHRVHIADDPAEILQRCRSGAVDAVLMDVNLPGAQWEGQAVSGTDIARTLKMETETAHIPIVLVTAYAMLSERQALMAASLADDFCTKPIINYEALLRLLDHLTAPRND